MRRPSGKIYRRGDQWAYTETAGSNDGVAWGPVDPQPCGKCGTVTSGKIGEGRPLCINCFAEMIDPDAA